MDEWIQLAALFLTTTALLFVFLYWWRRSTRPEDRFKAGEEGDVPPPLFGRFSAALAAQLPLNQSARTDLERDLRLAGFYRPTALVEYLALRTVLVLGPVTAGALLALLAPRERVGSILIGGLVAAMVGYSFPRLFLAVRSRMRARQMERGLPLAIDMLILCLSAGQNLLAALKQVSHEMSATHPVLGQELAIAFQQANSHSLEHALTQWSERVNVPDVTNLALLLVQSERLGTDAAGSLAELANNFRTTMRQRAEAQANRTSFWMLFPSVFCFWVAAAIVLVGPPYLEFLQHRRQTAQFFNQSKKNIDTANNRPGAMPDGMGLSSGIPLNVKTTPTASPGQPAARPGQTPLGAPVQKK